MHVQLNHMIARQRNAELHRAGEQKRLAVCKTQFTLHGRHIAKLDRFVGQAQRAARRTKREFEGVRLELDGRGTVSVHAIGMTSMLLEP
jgi:hypothetical protein